MNALNKTEIEQALRDCLRYLAPDKFPLELRPSDDVLRCCGLDSQDGVELACDLQLKLGIEIPLKDNPLILDDDGQGRRRARTLVEVVDYLTSLAN